MMPSRSLLFSNGAFAATETYIIVPRARPTRGGRLHSTPSTTSIEAQSL